MNSYLEAREIRESGYSFKVTLMTEMSLARQDSEAV